MSCPALERLAAAAADEDPRAAAHADDCARCAELLADQREVREVARTLPAPRLDATAHADLAGRVARGAAPISNAELAAVLSRLRPPQLDRAHRGELLANVLDTADDVVPIGAARGRIAVYATVAAAAAIAIVVAWAATHGTESSARVASPTPPPLVTPTPQRDPTVAAVPHVDPTPVTPHTAPKPVAVTPPTATIAANPTPPTTTAAIVAGGAEFTRAPDGDRDTVQLRNGVLDVDARGHAPIAVTIGDTTLAITDAQVEVVASNGVIVSAHAFAGSVERTTAGEHAVIAAGDVWTSPPGPATSLAAFRAGWEALHAGRTAAAIGAFDLATDPVVAEDAAFWAAVAAQRIDDRTGAKRRFTAFLAAYPDSPRADSARHALAQLGLQ